VRGVDRLQVSDKGKRKGKRPIDKFFEILVLASGSAGTGILLAIFLSLAGNALQAFRATSVWAMLTGRQWYPTAVPPAFGMLPLILGSTLVTLGARAISVPIGVGAAVYISQFAPPKAREWLKAIVEVLVAVPSVVFGFVALVVLTPLIQDWLHLDTGMTALAGSIVLALMAMPTIVSISEDAISSVPEEFRHGALAVGASQWQTTYRVVVPAATSGILASIMLGTGRAIGETMAVLMVTGNAAVMPHSLLVPVRTMTATIASEMGEVARGSTHFYVLFAVGFFLFLATFSINLVADWILERTRQGAGRR
jgi:phosphate transport system permease protein